MRIAFVSLETALHCDYEAIDRLTRTAELLAARGHDVTWFCAKWWTGEKSEWEHEGVCYRGLVDDLADARKFRYSLAVALPKFSPDVVHVGAIPPGQVSAASKGARVARAPVITDWYGDAANVSRSHRKALKRSDAVVVPSRLVQTRVWEHGVAEDAVEVIPNSVDMDYIESVDPVNAGDIVYSRRLDEGANLESVLLALAELRQVDWSAVVVGDGPERENYQRQARDLRIDDRITWLGECDREQRVAVYKGAHVFAQTAHECLFATELLWALASGCIGIVEYHADSSAHELVELRQMDAERGFRTTSESELADAIREAADMEHKVVDESFAEFDHRPVLERYLDCYREEMESAGLF
ncbi:glycosyltransferase [Haloarchaeobius sp. HME9146]|uniref:glycosyltransferase n=1 Tax=Haloarchaeobius sp. HME9146 TaxID=2978732 RepID=UPI0021BEE364|nr:glycosyltransferase [Haloarchaeobius sp. HME9146]MCT9095946.1 glycosyltransferase [Haloarchaeobius sp. HME9146]